MGNLQTPPFLVSRTEFTPHSSQDNQLGNSMVFVTVGVLLSDGEGGTEKATKNRAFRANAGPLLL